MENLADIFGTNIKVVNQPRQSSRQLVGFAGAHGMSSMNMGTRGRVITVTGRLESTDANYWVARANVQTTIYAIENYQLYDGASYTYGAQIFHYVVFEKFQLIIDGQGKAFHRSSGGKVFVNFVAILRSLL